MTELIAIPAIPALAAVVVGLAGSAAWTRVVPAIAALGCLVASLLVSVQAAIAGPVRLGTILRADALSGLELSLIASLALATFLYGSFGEDADPADDRRGMRAACSLAILALSTLAFLTASLGLMVVAIWGVALANAALAAMSPRPEAIRDAWRTLTYGCIGAALALIAAQIVGNTGAVCWTAATRFAFLLALAGLGATAGLAPANGWVRTLHTPELGPARILAASAALNTSVYAILRFQAACAPAFTGVADGLLVLAGAVTVLVAAVAMTRSGHLSDLLSGTTVAQTGLIVFAAGLGPVGVVAALHHTVHQALARALMVFGAGSLGERAGTDDLAGLAGAGTASRAAALAFAAGGLAVFGLPPTGPFVSLFAILGAGIDAGRTAATLVVGSALTVCLIAFAGAARRLFTGDRSQAAVRPLAAVPRAVLVVLALLVVGGIAVPAPVGDFIQLAAGALQAHAGTP